MDRLELFEKTLAAWTRYIKDYSSDDFVAIADFLRLAIEIEKRVRAGNRYVTKGEYAAFQLMNSTRWELGVLCGTALRDVSNTEVGNLLCSAGIQAKKLRRKLKT